MTDRVREAVFAVLGSRFGTPGELPALHVADVFAGSGSLGLEACSRGARSCLFFEHGTKALKALRENLADLNAGPSLQIVRQDVWSKGLKTSLNGEAFELILLDPPYSDSQDTTETGAVARFLVLGRRDRMWREDALLVLHHGAKVTFPDLLVDDWRKVDHRRYGSTGITFFQHEGRAPE